MISVKTEQVEGAFTPPSPPPPQPSSSSTGDAVTSSSSSSSTSSTSSSSSSYCFTSALSLVTDNNRRERVEQTHENEIIHEKQDGDRKSKCEPEEDECVEMEPEVKRIDRHRSTDEISSSDVSRDFQNKPETEKNRNDAIDRCTSGHQRSHYHSIQELLSPVDKIRHHLVAPFPPPPQKYSFPHCTMATAAAAANYFMDRDATPFTNSKSLDVLHGMLLVSAMGRDGRHLENNIRKEKWQPPEGEKKSEEDEDDEDDERRNKDSGKLMSMEICRNDFVDSMISPNHDNSSVDNEEEEDEELGGRGSHVISNGGQRHHHPVRHRMDDCDVLKSGFSETVELGDDDAASFPDETGSTLSDSMSFEEPIEAKRARMEKLETTRRPSSPSNGRTVDVKRPKRKQYIPKQHDARLHHVIITEPEVQEKTIRKLDKEELQQELRLMQERLAEMKEKYMQLFSEQNATPNGRRHGYNDFREAESSVGGTASRVTKSRDLFKSRDNSMGFEEGQTSPMSADTPAELEHLAGMLKAEISNSVGTLVDEILKNFIEKHKLQAKEMDISNTDADASLMKVSPEKSSSLSSSSSSSLHMMTEIVGPSQSRDKIKEDSKVDLKPQLFVHQAALHNSTSGLVLPHPVRPPTGSMLAEFAASYNNAHQQQKLKTKMSPEKYVHHAMFTHPPHLHPHQHKTAFDIPRAHLPLFPHSFFPHHQPVSNMAAAAAAAVAAATAAGMFNKEPEQTEALPLIVNTPTKKKRTKVTDTRLSPRAARAILQENGQQQQQQSNPRGSHHQQPYQSPHHHQHLFDPVNQMTEDNIRSNNHQQFRPPSNGEEQERESFFAQYRHHPLLPVSLPTSVAIPNPSLQHSDLMQVFYNSRKRHHRNDLITSVPAGRIYSTESAALPVHARSSSSSPEMAQSSSDGFSNSANKSDFADNFDQMMMFDDQNMTSTLTPMHLRKAKLMFFYVRYPSSAILKIFFPDVKFNKNNTAQLIKWFSNFREFYYIQMEKYARQALAEGVTNAIELTVNADSELYRVLVLHYNRNNRIEVPDNFRQTVQVTLREFFKSVQGEKDQEQSWKKAIYKIIAHLDDTVPEYFKSPNWVEQLADG